MNIPRWLNGEVSAARHSKSRIRLSMENNSGTRAEVYLKTQQARALRDRLDWILKRP